MKVAIIAVLAFSIYAASGQECPTYAYGVHDYGTDCSLTACTSNTDCTNAGEICCFTGCSSGDKFCTLAAFPGCPNPITAPLSPDCITDACTDSPCHAQIGTTCTSTCKMCVAEYRDSFNNIIPNSQCACPVGTSPVGSCTIAACTGLTCPAVPTAQCRVNSCGACTAHFYDSNGNRVTDCSTVTPCSSNPCENGGTCTVVGTSFNCTCTDDYEGDTCSERKRNLLRLLLLLQLFGGIGGGQGGGLLGGGPPQVPRQCPDSCADLWCPSNLAARCRVDPATCNAIFYDTTSLPVQSCSCPAGQQPNPSCDQRSCDRLQCVGFGNAVCKVSACGSCRFSFYVGDRGVPCTNY